jgi:hypothetical protein
LKTKESSSPMHRLLTVAVVASFFLGSACAAADSAPMRLSLAQLAADQTAYGGRHIQTQGTVRQFQDPNGTVYYVIEDSRANRVELTPASTGSAYVGQQVVVVGIFHVDDQRGRSIAVEHVNPPGG